MFSYLRLFFGASIVVILVAALALGWYYRIAANDIIIAQAEQNNVSLGQTFKSSVWTETSKTTGQQYSETMKLFYNLKPNERPLYQEYIDFGNKVSSLVQSLPVVQLNIYTPNGDKLYSTDPTQNLGVIVGSDGANIEMDSDISLASVQTLGKPQSEIIYNIDYKKNGAASKGVLARTLIPLTVKGVSKNAPVIEIYLDVSQAATTLRNFQYYAAGFIISVFMILYLTLFFTSRRAEKIIEKQYETNLELATAKSRAENENQQKSQFLANISHELRTPLNAIIGFSEIIKDEVMGPFENEQYKNYIKDIHSSGVHLLSLINDILDYSKAEAGKLDLEYEDIDLNKLIASSLRLQEPRAKSADVALVKDMLNEQLVIRSDSKRLKQVLINLLSNAVKFTPAGGTVKISAWINVEDKNTISIEVRDTGIGIAPQDIAKALSPFGQVDSELSRRYEGTGLGLPLTKKFVELLGGELRLESEVNRGTTVTVNIPVNNDPNGVIAR